MDEGKEGMGRGMGKRMKVRGKGFVGRQQRD